MRLIDADKAESGFADYCKDCDRSIFSSKPAAKSCDINIENNGRFVGAGDKCYCKIVNGKRAEKYSWEKEQRTLKEEKK